MMMTNNSPPPHNLTEDSMNEIPMLIRRCLANGITVYPYELGIVLEEYEKRKMPDEALVKLDRDKLMEYIKGLLLCAEEMARDWTRGHEILIGLGFTEVSRGEGHRTFKNVVWIKEFSTTTEDKVR